MYHKKGGFLMRDKVTLICSECFNRNYQTTKNKVNTKEKLEQMKYCSKCNKHTLHKEGK
jgi:large subunit ribosomal protein L33